MGMENDLKKEIKIFTVSDGTGETASNIVQAAKVQFKNVNIQMSRYNHIRNKEFLNQILMDAKSENATVIATLVDPYLRIFLLSRSMQLGIHVIDVLFPILETISEKAGCQPMAIPGLLRELDDGYFKKVVAIEYAVRHDDGAIGHELHDADIVLLGVSRTSKTPLSMYLAYKGYKVANIPIIPNVSLPDDVYRIDQNKIIGLIIDPMRLAEIRLARIASLSKSIQGDYTNEESIFEELEWSQHIFKRNRKWPVLDITGKALEENAVEIEKIICSRKVNS